MIQSSRFTGAQKYFLFRTRKGELRTSTRGFHRLEFRCSPGLPRGLRGHARAPAAPAQGGYEAPSGWKGDANTATADAHGAVRHPSPTGTRIYASHIIGNGLNTESSSNLRSLTSQKGLGTLVRSAVPWSHPGLPATFSNAKHPANF